ncbi:hypothetical protein [Actinomadura decatromicini]|uniref:LysM peptidoglycan-binding domain-containing protein n=1 Tax=Actinomadura decatromicini TaxID=2604572 RepID=A0A5D3F504_9ACTN|nr:hypothetical protein [Actinomadura decatromicini]TYK43064.1 hypothetical protein FXF68_39990 [Actinomadura decatromicini]
MKSVFLVLGFAGGLAVAPLPAAGPVPVHAVLAAAADVKYYVVARPRDGRPEFLYDIARRTLRDGARAEEIFELNKGRPQPGGGRLTSPATIEPGWVLVLPADAAGPGVRTGEPSASGVPAAPAGAEAARADGPLCSLPVVPALAAGAGTFIGVVLLTGGITSLRAKRRIAGDARRRRAEEQETAAARQAVDTGFWGPDDEADDSGRRLFRRRRTEPPDDAWPQQNDAWPPQADAWAPQADAWAPQNDAWPQRNDAWHQENAPGFWPPDGETIRRPESPELWALPRAAVRPRPDRDGHDGPPPRSDPFGRPGPVPLAAPPPADLTMPDLPPLVEYEVGFGDDLVTLAISGHAKATFWRPLPHDVPDGLAVVCLGAASRGCLFLDLGAVSGTVGIKGPADAVARLAEALVHQLSTDAGHASVALVGEVLAEMPDGPRVSRVRALSALAPGGGRGPVVAVMAAESAAEPDPPGGPRIVRLRLGGAGASCLMTVTPNRVPRARSAPDPQELRA